MHAVATEARARYHKGEMGKDVWREDMDPRTAVRARTIPVLEAEAARLRAQLAQVCHVITNIFLGLSGGQMEERNLQRQRELEEKVREKQEAEEKIKAIFDFLDSVRLQSLSFISLAYYFVGICAMATAPHG